MKHGAVAERGRRGHLVAVALLAAFVVMAIAIPQTTIERTELGSRVWRDLVRCLGPFDYLQYVQLVGCSVILTWAYRYLAEDRSYLWHVIPACLLAFFTVEGVYFEQPAGHYDLLSDEKLYAFLSLVKLLGFLVLYAAVFISVDGFLSQRDYGHTRPVYGRIRKLFERFVDLLERHSFAVPLVVICLGNLPFLLLSYPGPSPAM